MTEIENQKIKQLIQYQFKIESTTRITLGIYLLIIYLILLFLAKTNNLNTTNVILTMLGFAVVSKTSELLSNKSKSKFIQSVTDITIPLATNFIFIFVILSVFVATSSIFTTDNKTISINFIILAVLLLISIVLIFDGILRFTYKDKSLSELELTFRLVNSLIYGFSAFVIFSYLYSRYDMTAYNILGHTLLILFFVSYIVEKNYESWKNGHNVIDVNTLNIDVKGEDKYYIMTNYDYDLYQLKRYYFENQAKYPLIYAGGFGTLNYTGNIHIIVLTYIMKLQMNNKK